MELLDPYPESRGALLGFRNDLAKGNIPKPPLPAKFIRVTDNGGKPSMFFEGSGQRLETPASDFREVPGSTPEQAPIEHRTSVTFAQLMEAVLPPALLERVDFLEHLAQEAKLAGYPKCPLFLPENLEPQAVTAWLQTQDAYPEHDYSI